MIGDMMAKNLIYAFTDFIKFLSSPRNYVFDFILH